MYTFSTCFVQRNESALLVGPLTETSLPVDSLTKKIKGFAFITYMIPEHAVKAYTQLDGKVFQVRVLAII